MEFGLSGSISGLPNTEIPDHGITLDKLGEFGIVPAEHGGGTQPFRDDIKTLA